MTPDNSQLLCMACNILKVDREIDFRTHPMRFNIIPGPNITIPIRIHALICSEILRLAKTRDMDVSGWVGVAICNQIRADGGVIDAGIEAGIRAFAKARKNIRLHKSMVSAIAGRIYRQNSEN